MRSFWHALAFGLIFGQAAQAVAPAYRLAATLPLGGGVKWDYMRYNAANGDLYIAHGDELSVVDVAKRKVIGAVMGLDDSHGIAFDPASGLGFTDSSGTKTLSVFDPATLRAQKTLPSLADTDGIIFDPASRHMFVAAGESAAVLAVDPATDAATKIPLAGKPEFLAADGQGHVFVALNDRNEMAVVDSLAGRQVASWALPGCVAPTGVAIDPADRRLFTSCQNGKLAVLDTARGREVALLPIGLGTDAAGFDATRHVVLSANADGTLSVIKARDASHFLALPPVHTEKGARTLAVDEASGDVFLVTATPAATLPAKHPGWAARYKFVPGSLRLLIYQPAA